MNKITVLLPGLKPAIESNSKGYEFLLAVSSDSLLILDRNKNFVEWIVVGTDIDGVLAEADTEEDFLDAICVIRKLILSGINPLTELFTT